MVKGGVKNVAIELSDMSDNFITLELLNIFQKIYLLPVEKREESLENLSARQVSQFEDYAQKRAAAEARADLVARSSQMLSELCENFGLGDFLDEGASVLNAHKYKKNEAKAKAKEDVKNQQKDPVTPPRANAAKK